MTDVVRGSIVDKDTTTEFMAAIALKFPICVQEEDRFKRDGQLVVNLVSKSKWKGKGKVAEGKATASSATGAGEGTSGTKPFKLGPKKAVITKAEAEKELGKQVKAMRSDRGWEYYGSPESNGVSERKNRTLLNMVRSMMCTSGLPRFLWGEALKTTNYITNKTPSKAVAKTSFELWRNRKPSVIHVHVWGCKAEARPYNPKEGKLDPKTI
ncbi:hypothetical protein ACLB2K_049917 [Fragaria x ananassa]